MKVLSLSFMLPIQLHGLRAPALRVSTSMTGALLTHIKIETRVLIYNTMTTGRYTHNLRI